MSEKVGIVSDGNISFVTSLDVALAPFRLKATAASIYGNDAKWLSFATLIMEFRCYGLVPQGGTHIHSGVVENQFVCMNYIKE